MLTLIGLRTYPPYMLILGVCVCCEELQWEQRRTPSGGALIISETISEMDNVTFYMVNKINYDAS